MAPERTDSPDGTSPSRRRPRPRRRYAPGEDTRERILTAAVDHFSRYGYTNTSIARIATDAGISDAAVIHHFGTKKELFLTAVDVREQPFVPVVAQSGSARELFEQFVSSVRESMAHPELVRFRAVLNGEALLESNPASERLRSNMSRILAALVPVLERGIADGELKPDTDARQVILELLALNDGVRSQWATLPDEIDLPAVFATAADALLARISVDGRGLSRDGQQ
ncbi:TetR/AcrR family transcriptional regulator [Rhodococcus sp. UNC363MFTsu5.1]|uniref:TetR/AcrR family transcriptional regulator n=1 Tax=Rhodococcus sp. UNC363MFTsu5.1 TaxID=1449069 RepID=UPI00068B7371|nr:TetR/AcrR family transcriptional regulator [Rhodococcus sp. UNC363MFTsu5.1]